jgi:hypothetical protein
MWFKELTNSGTSILKRASLLTNATTLFTVTLQFHTKRIRRTCWAVGGGGGALLYYASVAQYSQAASSLQKSLSAVLPSHLCIYTDLLNLIRPKFSESRVEVPIISVSYFGSCVEVHQTMIARLANTCFVLQGTKGSLHDNVPVPLSTGLSRFIFSNNSLKWKVF